jgi:NAD(P)-dependent dehydrogenase (short-subunit alcohol dehydrogenase family)
MSAGALDGKVVLLTGASGGIGSLTARALGASGADLIGHYRSDRAGAEAAVAEIPRERCLLLQGDLAAPGSSRALWRKAMAWKGRIDVVVVNAAMLARTPFDGPDEQWDEGWAETMRVNVVEPASLAREAVAHFRARGGGTLITISSWAAQAGSALSQVPAYAASKAAIRNLTQTIARNYAKDGVLAYVVAPGIVRTPMSEISAEARGGIDQVHAALAMGEMVPPEEVAELVAFLATGSCSHLTGATLDMNGASYVR